MRHITLSSMACPTLTHFYTIRYKLQNFRENKSLNIKYVLIFSTNFVANISQSKDKPAINTILKSGNACYHSVQSLLSSSLLSKCVKIIYRNIIWPVVLCGCGTWSVTLGEECRLRVLENRVLRRI